MSSSTLSCNRGDAVDITAKNPVQRNIFFAVVFIHALFLFMILFCNPSLPPLKKHKPLIVHTVQPKPVQKITTLPTSKPQAPSTPKPQPAPKPEVKKQQTPAVAPPAVKKQLEPKTPAIADKKLSSPQPTQKPKAAPEKARAKISDSLLKELEESIAKIETKSDKPTISKKTISSSKAMAPIVLQIDSQEEQSAETMSYTDTLISYLHQELRLPDYGEVKIQLSLRQDGTVAKLSVLKAKNEKNRQYLESQLSRLRFPCFEGTLANKKEHTFVLTFCNEQ